MRKPLSKKAQQLLQSDASNPPKKQGAEEKVKEPKLSYSERALMNEHSKKFDPSATKEDCIEDLRRLQAASPYRFITRTAYRADGKYSEATWNSFFGTFQEFRRQAGIELTRHQHKIEREIAKHAAHDHYREFFHDEVSPFIGKYIRKDKSGRVKVVLSGSDFHDLEADPFVLAVFIETARRLQPDVIILNGDVFDEYEFSRFTIDPRQMAIAERFRFVRDRIFRALREVCPDSQIDLVIGNHEYRILKLMADKTPNLRVLFSDVLGMSLSTIFGLEEFGINLVAKVDLAAFTKKDTLDEVRNNYQVYYDCFVAAHIKDYKFGVSGTSGHTHHPKFDTSRNIPMDRISWTVTGSIAKCEAEYIDGYDSAMNSFLIAHIDPNRRQVSPEHIVIPGDFVCVGGVYYHRTEGGLLVA